MLTINITRRAVTRALVVISAIGSSGAAFARFGSQEPLEAANVAPEAPHDRITRLGAEMSEALAEYDGGAWHARVYATGHPHEGLWFCRMRDGVDKLPSRKVLYAYWEWLENERRTLARELHPDHPQVERFTPMNTEAHDYHTPQWAKLVGKSLGDGAALMGTADLPSTRAVQVLTLVGIDVSALDQA